MRLSDHTLCHYEWIYQILEQKEVRKEDDKLLQRKRQTCLLVIALRPKERL